MLLGGWWPFRNQPSQWTVFVILDAKLSYSLGTERKTLERIQHYVENGETASQLVADALSLMLMQ